MNTSPHTARRNSPHAPLHDNPKHNLPLNPGHKLTLSSRPSKTAPRTQPESPPTHSPSPHPPTQPPSSYVASSGLPKHSSSKSNSRSQPEYSPTHSPPPQLSTTYALSPGPTKPIIPTPWQQVEELSLIQRELTAELLSTQGKNKGLVAENASLRERVSQLERDAQIKEKPSTRLLQLEAENHRLSGDLARIVRGSYDRETNSFDVVHKELLALKKEQQRIDKYICDSTEKQEGLQTLLQRMVENEQEDRAALDEIVGLTEQYTEHLKNKAKEADETIRSLQPEVSGLQARVAQSTGLITDARLQITEIGEACAGQNQVYAALRHTVETLQADLQERVGEMGDLQNEVTVLISANEGQSHEIESLRTSLHQATVARDEAQGELERLRMKATSLEDEQHFLQTEFSAKSADMLEKFSAQIHELAAQANEYRVALEQLRVENVALGMALQESTNAPRAEQDLDAQAEILRQTRIAEAHLQAVRDAERANAILEEQLRQKDAEIVLLQSAGGAGRRDKKEKSDKRELGETEEIGGEGEGESSDGGEIFGGKTCAACARYKVRVTQATQELNATKLECGNLQQKLDKVKNLIHIYRQEKRQMEDYIEKEKRTAKSMIADVESLREVIEEKQTLVAQLRDEVTHLRNEALRTQQTYAQQLSHAQDLARIQVQLKEDEVRAKMDVQATMQKEIQRLQAKLQRRKEELRAAQRAKKEADQTLEAQYDRLQHLDRNYVNTRHHHANYTNSTLSYLHALESRLADMRSEIARAKQTQASCEAEVIEPLRSALRAVWALAQDAQRQCDADTRAQEEELVRLKAIVAALPAQLQQPQLQQLQQQVQLQQQLQQQQQQNQEQKEQHQEILEQHEQLVLEQAQQIDELRHQVRLLQLQLLEERQKPTLENANNEKSTFENSSNEKLTQERDPSRAPALSDISQLYTHLDKTQELVDQMRILSDESLYSTERLELIDAAQQRAEQELATQRQVFEEMRTANEAFMRSLEEQLVALVQATPRYLENLEEPDFKLKTVPDSETYNFVNGMTHDDALPDIEVKIPTPRTPLAGLQPAIGDELLPSLEVNNPMVRTPRARLHPARDGEPLPNTEVKSLTPRTPFTRQQLARNDQPKSDLAVKSPTPRTPRAGLHSARDGEPLPNMEVKNPTPRGPFIRQQLARNDEPKSDLSVKKPTPRASHDSLPSVGHGEPLLDMDVKNSTPRTPLSGLQPGEPLPNTGVKNLTPRSPLVRQSLARDDEPVPDLAVKSATPHTPHASLHSALEGESLPDAVKTPRLQPMHDDEPSPKMEVTPRSLLSQQSLARDGEPVPDLVVKSPTPRTLHPAREGEPLPDKEVKTPRVPLARLQVARDDELVPDIVVKSPMRTPVARLQLDKLLGFSDDAHTSGFGNASYGNSTQGEVKKGGVTNTEISAARDTKHDVITDTESEGDSENGTNNDTKTNYKNTTNYKSNDDTQNNITNTDTNFTELSTDTNIAELGNSETNKTTDDTKNEQHEKSEQIDDNTITHDSTYESGSEEEETEKEEKEEGEGKEKGGEERKEESKTSVVSGFNNFLSNIIDDTDDEESEGD